MTALGWLALLLLFLPASGILADEGKARHLKGIPGFTLIVEKPTEDGQRAGIREEALRDQVIALFQSSLAHVPLDFKGGPILYIRVLLYKRKSEDLYYGTVSLAVDRPVSILSPSGDFLALAQVWENTIVFSGREPLLSVYQMVAQLTRLLIEDYRKANP